jgi:hypothetical protein
LSEDVLKKEVAEIMALDVYQEVVKGYIEKTLEDKSGTSTIARMEAAKAIGLMDPRAPAAEKLADLLEDDSIEVNRYAMESAARLNRKEDIPSLIGKLRNPVLREDATNALVRFGPKIAGTLTDYLADRTEDPEVRQAMPGILARIGTQEAADFLSLELAGAEGELAAEIIDALDRIRTDKPQVRFSGSTVRLRILKEVKSYCQDLVRALEDQARGEKKEASSQQKKEQAESVWNIFRLLGLIYAHQDMVKAYQNLKTGTKDSVAYALELLDNVLEKDIRDAVFPVVEDIPVEERTRRCRSLVDSLSGGRNKE